ncbi:MAG TPA: DAK2 domain-containing protein [Thermoflexia bacterium]|nr:DAK2 domain-containing protein [Thermoflexia bacterium]
MTDEKSETVARRHPRLGTDGQGFKQLVKAALAWLQHHQEAINVLNVYPVPDGDTGTNMVLTMRSAWDEIKDTPERDVGRVAHQMAHGALMGARGNSGVILSQIWRGFARSLDGKKVYRAPDLAAACRGASTTAYKGVVKPVEGTILTVARAVADAATQVAEDTQDLVRMLEHMVFAAHEAVVLTPSLLPVLKEAGVVDAGGQGLFIILEGMLRQMRGEPVAEDLQMTGAVDLISTELDPGEAGYGYDVQFLIVGQDIKVDAVRQRIAEMGECPLVVGDPATVKVHVHVPDPGVPVSYGASLGSLRDVVVEDMQAQYQDFIAERELPPVPLSRASDEIGVVAVVMGDGLAHVFQSLGVGGIVRGGQTMNPSTQDLLEAAENVPAKRVILLPNNSNVILAAEQACGLSDKPLAVVPSRSVPQGLAALLAINYQADFETNVDVMTSVMEDVETGEVTTATRSATINGVEVAAGQIIGLHEGDLKATGAKIENVVQMLLKEMGTAEREIITLYHGESVGEGDAFALADLLQQDWPDQEIEVISGGQPHYHYILSVE